MAIKKQFASREAAIAAIASSLVEETDGPHIVVGPQVWHEDMPGEYFIVSFGKNGWHAISVMVSKDVTRAEFLQALWRSQKPLVVYDFDDELEAARWCEAIWPGDRIARVRKSLEDERAARAQPN